MRFSKPLWSWREYGMLSGSAHTRSSFVCAVAAHASAAAARAFRKGEDMEGLSFDASLKSDRRILGTRAQSRYPSVGEGRPCLPQASDVPSSAFSASFSETTRVLRRRRRRPRHTASLFGDVREGGIVKPGTIHRRKVPMIRNEDTPWLHTQ